MPYDITAIEKNSIHIHSRHDPQRQHNAKVGLTSMAIINGMYMYQH